VYKKILVIRFSSLGDVILTLPFLQVLKEKFPEAEINYCIKQSYSGILRNNPVINEIITIDDELSYAGLKEFRKKLIAGGYDLVFDLHNNLRTFYLKLALERLARFISLKKYSFRKLMLVKLKINLMKNLPPIYRRYMNTLRKIASIQEDTNKFFRSDSISIDKQAESTVQDILEKNHITSNKRLILILPGSKHFTKTYPAEYYVKLINKLDVNNYNVILAGSKEDSDTIDSIKSFTKNNVFDLCGKLNLLELAGVMKKCQIVIGGDTGPIHIAEALNIPLIMIAGSSVKEFGFYPQSEKAIVLENNNLSCRPCSHIGRDKCPKGHFKCMKEITDGMVWEKLNLILSRSV
jgi:lipopolysaccharide heptosyltransferase II